MSDRAEIGGLVPLGLAFFLIGPSLWGFGGQLEPVDQPEEWSAARRAVTADPGPVIALPWGQYLRPGFLDGRLVHNPVPTLLGGDVLIASGRGTDKGLHERADPRQGAADDLALRLQSGLPAERELDALGIRWVVVLDSLGVEMASLDANPSLEVTVRGDSLTLYAVDPSPGRVINGQGEILEIDERIGPLLSVDSDDAATWFRPGAGGWLRGLEPATATSAGNVALPPTGGLVWYWPTVLVLAADGLVLIGVLLAIRGGLPTWGRDGAKVSSARRSTRNMPGDR